MLIDLKYVGKTCQNFRRGRGLLQSKVAEDTGYVVENISAFENGRNDNLRILLWYVDNGLNINNLIRRRDGK